MMSECKYLTTTVYCVVKKKHKLWAVVGLKKKRYVCIFVFHMPFDLLFVHQNEEIASKSESHYIPSSSRGAAPALKS